MFGLDPSDKKAVGKYSLGMKQKLALSMAFLEDPKVLILDEPLSALDADSVQEARKRILEEKERGKLVLIASHYPEDIQSLCDEVYWMKNGHVYRRRKINDVKVIRKRIRNGIFCSIKRYGSVLVFPIVFCYSRLIQNR